MATKWIKTTFPGVRYREHPDRRHGVKRDQYFVIRFKLEGKDVEESIGWASEGHTASAAFETLAELKRNIKSGTGPRTLAEKRALADQARQEAERVKALEARERIPFADIWTEYLAQAQADRGEKALEREVSIYSLWIRPSIGPQPLNKVTDYHLEKIKSNMLKAGRAPRSIQYCFAIIRQVFNFAISRDMFSGINPVKPKKKSQVKLPAIENKRTRFLTREEADQLLDALREVSTEVHDHALISLQTGARASEIWKLRWADVNLETGILTLLDTKNKKSRPAYMTGPVKAMLRARRPANPDPSALVFPSRTGGRIGQVSSTFDRTVDKLGYNAGIKDRRHKVTFHTLRHTFASWHVQNGTDIYVLKELLGHSTIQLTERYAHLGENASQAATNNFDRALNTGTGKVLDFNKAANQ